MINFAVDGTFWWLCKYFYYLKAPRLIVAACGLGPYSLAFPDSYETQIDLIDYIQNSIFLIDIFLNFLSAFETNDYEIIDNPIVIFV